jgi:hypothetical protein
MVIKIKLKNADESVLIDDYVYEFISNNPVLKNYDFLKNLRKHSQGMAVYQKWWATPDKKGRVETIYLHKFIAEKYIPMPVDAEGTIKVAFKNKNKLDCRIANLEWSNASIITRKSKIYNKHGYRGVVQDKKKFVAVIYIDQKLVRLGRFNTPEEAADAYNKKSVELYGDKIKPNRIKKKENME